MNLMSEGAGSCIAKELHESILQVSIPNAVTTVGKLEQVREQNEMHHKINAT